MDRHCVDNPSMEDFIPVAGWSVEAADVTRVETACSAALTDFLNCLVDSANCLRAIWDCSRDSLVETEVWSRMGRRESKLNKDHF